MFWRKKERKKKTDASHTQTSSHDGQYRQEIFQAKNQDMWSDSKIELRRTTKHKFEVIVKKSIRDDHCSHRNPYEGMLTHTSHPCSKKEGMKGNFPFYFETSFMAT